MNQEDVVFSIKKAARDLFRKYGYNKTSVNELVKQSNNSKGKFYIVIPNKKNIIHERLIDYIRDNVENIISSRVKELDLTTLLGKMKLRDSSVTYTVCNEFVGWEFIRESTNAQ